MPKPSSTILLAQLFFLGPVERVKAPPSKLSGRVQGPEGRGGPFGTHRGGVH